MFNDFLNKVQQLYQQKDPFVIAMVVNRTAPSSSKPGDKAVITTEGIVAGWIGGGCTKGIVFKEALLAIKERKSRLVKISPEYSDNENETDVSGVKTYKMTCQSRGAVEVYLEPIMPKPKVVIMGKSHIAMALCTVSKAMDYQVVVYGNDLDKNEFQGAEKLIEGSKPDDSELTPNTFIVVCTQGENDEVMLRSALATKVGYVAFVSSKQKGADIMAQLEAEGIEEIGGIDKKRLNALKTPAGIDINAKLPEEVAISILAEIIKEFRAETDPVEEKQQSLTNNETGGNKAYFVNPVCNIPIEKSSAKHILAYKGIDYFFCCDGCKISFENDPEKYALTGKS